MKTPYDSELGIQINLPDKLKQEMLRDGLPRFCSIALEKPIQQGGREFSFLVTGVELANGKELSRYGKAVLCQTEAEAIESRQLLSLAAKEDMGMVQIGNLACPGFLKPGGRFLKVEQGWECKTLPGGKRKWEAIERTIDRATGEINVKRKQECRSKKVAMDLAQKWAAEYNREKEDFDQVAKSKEPLPPPPHCDPLTPREMDDAKAAQTDVLRRQWQNCFKLFDMRKAGHHFSIDDCRKAYLLDLAELRENPLSVRPPNGTTSEFFAELAKAWTRASKAKKKLISQRADYLIAFNYPLGWCYLSDKEIAKRISSIVKYPFTAAQIKKRRQNLRQGPSAAPGLVSKHRSGPPSKSP